MTRQDKVGKPFANNKLTKWLDAALDASPKTAAEIAENIGYKFPNMISMIRSGATALPWDKIIPLARELEFDPRALMVLWFEQHHPDRLSDIRKIFAPQITEDQWKLLDIFNAGGQKQFNMTDSLRRDLEAVAEKHNLAA